MVGGAVEPRYDDTPRLPSGFDPSKWVFDPRTGEFHKVTARIGTDSLLDSRTHEQRHLDYLLKVNETRKQWMAIGAGWFAALIVLVWGMSGNSGMGALFLLIFILCGAGPLIGYTLHGAYQSVVAVPLAQANIGPPPPPRPGRETVERQKVHGAGGVLGGDRLREAARGGSLSNEGATPLETYDD